MKTEYLYRTQIITAAIINFALSAFIVMLLWNWLMPTILGLIKINYIQSVGLYMLCNLLFKSYSKNWLQSKIDNDKTN